jgi:excinuclease ABC subunit B
LLTRSSPLRDSVLTGTVCSVSAFRPALGPNARYQRVADRKGKYRGGPVLNQDDLEKQILSLEKQMFEHARSLEFEDAARLRDEIEELRQQFVRS